MIPLSFCLARCRLGWRISCLGAGSTEECRWLGQIRERELEGITNGLARFKVEIRDIDIKNRVVWVYERAREGRAIRGRGLVEALIETLDF